MLTKSIDKNTECFTFSDFQTFIWSFVDWDHQILHLFIVDFTHHSTYFVELIFIIVISNSIENFNACQWNNTSVSTITNHGMTLARTCLTICKKTGVISMPSIIKYWFTNLFENILLIFVVRSFIWCTITISFFVVAAVTLEWIIKGKFFNLTFSENIGTDSLCICHRNT